MSDSECWDSRLRFTTPLTPSKSPRPGDFPGMVVFEMLMSSSSTSSVVDCHPSLIPSLQEVSCSEQLFTIKRRDFGFIPWTEERRCEHGWLPYFLWNTLWSPNDSWLSLIEVDYHNLSAEQICFPGSCKLSRLYWCNIYLIGEHSGPRKSCSNIQSEGEFSLSRQKLWRSSRVIQESHPKSCRNPNLCSIALHVHATPRTPSCVASKIFLSISLCTSKTRTCGAGLWRSH